MALEKQGYFQDQPRDQAQVFRDFYIRNLPFDPDREDDVVGNTIDSVASAYSRFFLIESFFQKSDGVSFNQESLVYKTGSPDALPIVLQRQYDWLPLQDISIPDEDDS